MSKMEEETGKYTEQQLAETMLEFSGIHISWGLLMSKGKMLMVGWKATKLEVIQVIRYNPWFDCVEVRREVCDALLDKSVPAAQRALRAEAILMIGRIFRAAERDPG